MASILDGKKLSERILEDLRRKIKKSGKKLKIAAVLVGDDKNSKIFLRQKEKACQFVGVDFQLFKFPKNISQQKLAEKIKGLRCKLCHGIVIQLPLPKHINTREILNLIPPEKDIDCLSEKSKNLPILSPVLGGILKLFKEYKINFKDKKVVVVGKGILVGRPIAQWLKKQKVDVISVDAKTKNIASVTKKADILISGVGKPGLIKGDMVKRGVVVVDVAGDIDFKSVAPKASFITPVPGGVGPMTVACLIDNLFILNRD